jgi:H+-transporting ATPase
VLEAVFRDYIEAAVIAGLLIFNAVLGLFQEGRAGAPPVFRTDGRFRIT